VAETLVKVTAAELVLVIWSGRLPVLPRRMVPKSRAAGVKVRKEGVAAPARVMKSREELESERISMAPTRVPEVWGKK
jgi:hypothetical protein